MSNFSFGKITFSDEFFNGGLPLKNTQRNPVGPDGERNSLISVLFGCFNLRRGMVIKEEEMRMRS